MRVVICDDHRLLAECLTQAFRDAGHEVVAVADSPWEAAGHVERQRPDALLLDLSFPDGDSLDCARAIAASQPATAVVMLTASDSLIDARRALDAGVSGYLRKDEPVVRIIDAVERCTRGTRVVDEPTLRRLARTSQPAARCPDTQRLTSRESDVADLLVAGLNTAQIVRQLGIRESTVRRHIQAIFGKLAVHSRIEAVASLAGPAGPAGDRARQDR